MIRDIVLGQKRELEQRMKEKYVPKGINFASGVSDIIYMIIGPRRAGKSFFGMHQLAKGENAMASELYKRCLYKGLKLFYWKDRDQQDLPFYIFFQYKRIFLPSFFKYPKTLQYFKPKLSISAEKGFNLIN